MRVVSAGLLLALIGCGEKPARPRPLLLFGSSGAGPGEFNYPRAAAKAPDGTVYIVDKAGRIQRFDEDGRFLLGWTMAETSAGRPTGLGVGPDGSVYAADTHYARVVAFSADGKEIERFGTRGDEPGQFRLPTDVAVDAHGNIYVSEYGGNDRITKFTPKWKPIVSFGGRDSGAARLERPQSLCISRDGTLWVADSCNHRVCHFSADGEFLGAFGKLGAGAGELRFPYNVDELPDGTLVVCEFGNNRVQRFDRAGSSLGIWGTAGRDAGELAYPWALAVVGDGRVFVVDSGNNRVQAFDGLSRRAWRQAGGR